jgi:hypothetical protein
MGGIIATEQISLDGVVEAPAPGDIGDRSNRMTTEPARKDL